MFKFFKNALLIAITVSTAPVSAFASHLVTCESQDRRFEHCRVSLQGVTNIEIDRRYSKASCEQGRSWGVDRYGIWVDHGCRARFAIIRSGYGYPPHSQNCSYNWHPHDSSHKHDYYGYHPSYQYSKRPPWSYNSHKHKPQVLRCPPGSRPGRCGDQQRRYGCKDWREPNGVGCYTG